MHRVWLAIHTFVLKMTNFCCFSLYSAKAIEISQVSITTNRGVGLRYNKAIRDAFTTTLNLEIFD